jgi:hypothetical protein
MLGRSLVIGLMILFSQNWALAAEEKESALPSLELLEFLGEFETEDGEWIDPIEIGEIDPSDGEQKDADQKDP